MRSHTNLALILAYILLVVWWAQLVCSKSSPNRKEHLQRCESALVSVARDCLRLSSPSTDFARRLSTFPCTQILCWHRSEARQALPKTEQRQSTIWLIDCRVTVITNESKSTSSETLLTNRKTKAGETQFCSVDVGNSIALANTTHI